VTVRIDIIALELNPGDGVLKVGTAVQLNLFARNRSGRLSLIPGNMAAWSSSDNQVGDVNRQGRLTPRRAGSVTITASTTDHRITAAFTVVD
jgi:uncharacterized protein YjdB